MELRDKNMVPMLTDQIVHTGREAPQKPLIVYSGHLFCLNQGKI